MAGYYDYKNTNPVWYPGMVLPGVGEVKAGGGISKENPFPFSYAPGMFQGTNSVTGSTTVNGVTTPAAGYDFQTLTDITNSLDQANQQKANAGRIPGSPALEQSSSANIGSALRGEVPSDVMNVLAQGAAERGVGTGSPMGPATNTDYLKALGLTSTGMMNTGQQWLSAADARNPAAQVTPSAGIYQTIEQQKMEQQRLAQQMKIAEMNNATQRAIASMRGSSGGGGGGVSTPSLSPMTPFPNLFPDDSNTPYVNPDATAIISSSGSSENRWMPLPSDPYFNLGSGWTPQPTPTPSFGTLFPDNNWSDLGGGYDPSAFGTNTGYGGGGYNDWSLGDVGLGW